MSRRPAAGLAAASVLGLLLSSGCHSETNSESASSPGGPDYGPNKMPPAAQVAPKAGKGGRAPGAPPFRR